MGWPFWVVLAWAVVASLVLFVYTTKLLPLPVPDRGFRIFVCKDAQAMDDVGAILAEIGFAPGWRLDSQNVRRLLMKDRITILNTSTPKLQKMMGNPAAALVIPVADPQETAYRVDLMLTGRGYLSEVGALPEVAGKPEAMYYVSSTAFPGWVLIFRYSMLRMGKPELRHWYRGSR